MRRCRGWELEKCDDFIKDGIKVLAHVFSEETDRPGTNHLKLAAFGFVAPFVH